jgi:NitT/TauT family transport system ATP-binding protein
MVVTTEETAPGKFHVRDIGHSYQGTDGNPIECLVGINLVVHENEFLSVVGPSGCGKSSLLDIMSGLIYPGRGSVFLDGTELTGITSKIGYISQADSLLPWRTVLGNVEFGLEVRGLSKKERRDVARDLIARAGLAGFEKNYPHELSGGMKKRVDIIRVLAVDPEVIFMDEPFGALDYFTKEKLQEYILDIWRNTGKTIVFITHDLPEAVTMSDRVIIMTARPGSIKNQYPISLPRPRNPYEIRFDSAFIELNRLIWEDLKDEIARAGEANRLDRHE